MRRNFLKDCSSFCRSAKDTSKTRPFSPSLANSKGGEGHDRHIGGCCYETLLFPCVLVTNVLPMFLTENIAGDFTSYQSFFVKGSMLRVRNASIINPGQSHRFKSATSAQTNFTRPTHTLFKFKATYIFFFAPFFPLVNLLFLPTAMMVGNKWKRTSSGHVRSL